jgi:hypothetical protein
MRPRRRRSFAAVVAVTALDRAEERLVDEILGGRVVAHERSREAVTPRRASGPRSP